MAATRQTVAQTLEEIITWRPVLAPVLRSFEPLLSAQEDLVGELTKRLKELGLELPQGQPNRMDQGVSLLAGATFAGFAPAVLTSAEKLLPLLSRMDAVVPYKDALEAFFLKSDKADAQKIEELVATVVSGNKKNIEGLAQKIEVDPLVLHFVAGFVVAPVLRALTSLVVAAGDEAPWEVGDVWRQGYCPMCGALPTMGWMDKPAIDEKNAFLAGGGGKKHLHCGTCGADWKYRRGACPACGEEGSGVMELLRESGKAAHGERLDWCTKCKSYCPAVDLREREFIPNLDALALGMMHLDMVAARRKLKPVKPSFWNMF